MPNDTFTVPRCNIERKLSHRLRGYGGTDVRCDWQVNDELPNNFAHSQPLATFQTNPISQESVNLLEWDYYQ